MGQTPSNDGQQAASNASATKFGRLERLLFALALLVMNILKNEVTRTPIKDFGDPYTNRLYYILHSFIVATPLSLIFNLSGAASAR